MALSRRDWGALLPALAAAQTGQRPKLTSKVYHSTELPYKGDEKRKGRQFFLGAGHTGFKLELHETILGPGVDNGAPHKQLDEVIMIVVEGAVEALVGDVNEIAEAGSVIFVGSNQMHGMRNAGKTPCRYYVVELHGSEA
jgi:mannose-6-phosphate isomerase-like protein (cupin superfamily)